MKPAKEPNILPFHRRIIFWLVLPVVIVGIFISGILIAYLSPPMESFLIDHFGANLRLASKLGLGVCENHFNQLLDMRLEDSPEMNKALQEETLNAINTIGQQVPSVHLLVVVERQLVKTISIDFPLDVFKIPPYANAGDTLYNMKLGKEKIIAHIAYFPFWDWHIVSFVFEKNYRAPIRTARQIVYLSTMGVLGAVFLTLLFMFRHLVTKPLNRLILATQDVAVGKLLPVVPLQDNEIGQLMGFFNKMVESLRVKTDEVGELISQLKESERRYRGLVELSPEAVLVHQEGKIKYINSSGAKMFGAANPGELIDKPVLALVHPASLDVVRSRINAVYRDHVTVPSYELRFLKMDKSEIRVESSGTFIEYAGKPAMLNVVRDITERQQAEDALRESEEKLARSKKMESLGLLAGGVAHDLNNVLSGIVSYPELILMDLPVDSKFRKPVETIQASGQRAAAIVQDLLTVARGVAINRKPLSLNELVDEYLHSPEFNKLKQLSPTVTVKTDLDSGLFNLNGSQIHLKKIVMNLVANAAEAIESRGNVTIATTNRYLDRPLRGYADVTIGEYVILSVADEGPGISPDDLERIFEPFYTKKVMGRSGTGLGLAVVWNIVMDHKGYIDVVSDENGTRFELYFPITREKISAKDSSIPIEDLKGNQETVLVVDDVDSQRDISCKMLEMLDYNTEPVASGEAAVAYLKKNSVDLMLIDMIMDPGINGCETYRRTSEIHPNQKAVIVSGFAETAEVKKAQKLGAGQYIKKPFSLEELGVAIKAELGK